MKDMLLLIQEIKAMKHSCKDEDFQAGFAFAKALTLELLERGAGSEMSSRFEEVPEEQPDPVGDAYANGYADGYKAKAIASERESRRERALAALVAAVLLELGAWREAVALLEDYCSKPVCLKNMTAALDSMNEWEKQAGIELSKIEVQEGK